MTNPVSSKIPEGFEIAPNRGPFLEKNGPIWWKPGTEDDAPVFGMLPDKQHTNALGFVHGGMISTFADSAMAQSVYERFRCRLVTLELAVTYRHVIPMGRWMEAHITLQEVEHNRVQATTNVMSRKTLCATAKGEFQLFPEN